MKKYLFFTVMIIFCSIIFFGCQTYSNDYDSNSNKTKGAEPQDTIEIHQKLIDQSHLKGPKDAKVTLIEISDFDCPACRNYHPEIKKIVDEYDDKIQFGFICYPLSYHQNAQAAAYATEAADKQGKYWQIFEKFFGGDKFNPDEIEQHAKDLELNLDQFNKDRGSDEIKQAIEKGMQLAQDIGLKGTPTFLINGEQIQFNPTYENLKKEIEQIFNE